jgi:hypothetical protein
VAADVAWGTEQDTRTGTEVWGLRHAPSEHCLGSRLGAIAEFDGDRPAITAELRGSRRAPTGQGGTDSVSLRRKQSGGPNRCPRP